MRLLPFRVLLSCAALALVSLPAQALDIRPVATASHETAAFYDDDAGGNANADDPAIWVHPGNPARSLVLGTLKEGGLAVFGLDGRTLQRIAAPAAPRAGDAAGRFNNVDIVEGFRLAGELIDLAVVTDRGRDTLRLYRIDPQYGYTDRPPLRDVTDTAVPWVFSRNTAEVNAQTTAYGLAVMATPGGGALAAVSQRERTRLSVLDLFDTGRGTVSYRQRQSLDLPASFALGRGKTWTPCQDEDGVRPQVEGMVFDTRSGALYAAQEQVGIWRIALNDPTRPQLIDRVRTYGVPYQRVYDPSEEEYACDYSTRPRDRKAAGKHLSADAEGLTILHTARGSYLFASSQGDSSFVVYDMGRQHRVVGGFRVAEGPSIDGSEHSDGAALTPRALGPLFPQGLLVVHDGENTPEALDADGEARENTNFKFVPLQRVLRLD